MTKRVLLLGGTGAIGRYLAPELASQGFTVNVTSRSKRRDKKGVTYIEGDAHSEEFLKQLLKKGKYDVIVDFMVYTTDEFKTKISLFLASTTQYIYLSSYRVFADAQVITEKTPRLLDVSKDTDYLKTQEYALEKARQEDLLRSSDKKNWTIVRPAITYSSERFQLGTLEADVIVWRTLHNAPVILPVDMLEKYTTMTWAGDVARMCVGLVLNPKAYGDDFNVATSEYHRWSEVAEIYKQAIGLKIVPVTSSEYIDALGGEYVKYQLNYDRMFNRAVDNTKVLQVTGLTQKDFKPLEWGLRQELASFLKKPNFEYIDYAKQARIDRLTNTILKMKIMNTGEKKEYLKNRFPELSKNAMKMKHFTHRVRSKVRIRTRLNEAKIRSEQKSEVRRVERAKQALLKQYRQENKEFLASDGAILTLPGYFNYGNLVQRYALQYFLKLKGFNFVSYVRDMPIETKEDEVRFKYTHDFVQRTIWRKLYDPRDEFKAYIVGSDQVWRNWSYYDELDSLGFFFLDFTRNMKTKRIAYAASFGQDSLEDALITEGFANHVAPVVKAFSAIGIRELSGIKLAKKVWGVDAQHVSDPTMLLTSKDYDKLIESAPYRLKAVKPIFTYFIRNNDDKRKLTQKICKSVGLESDGIDLEDTATQMPPVESWIKGIRDAELLVTDSFHGVVFAILYNTPFVLLESGTGGVGRTATLLSKLGLENRYVTSDRAKNFVIDTLSEINWDEVNERVNVLRKQSSKWLLAAVRSGKRTQVEKKRR